MYTYNVILRSPDAQGTYQDEAMEIMANQAIPFTSLMEYMGTPISARYYMIAIKNQRDTIIQQIQFDTQDRMNNREMREMHIETSTSHTVIIIPTDNEEIYRDFRRNHVIIEAGENIGAQIYVQPIEIPNTINQIIQNIRGCKFLVAKTNADTLNHPKIHRFLAHQQRNLSRNTLSVFLVSNELPPLLAESIHPQDGAQRQAVNVYTIADNGHLEEEIFSKLNEVITKNIEQDTTEYEEQFNQQKQIQEQQRATYANRLEERKNQQRTNITRNQPLIADSIAALMGEEESMDTSAANRMIGDIASNPNVIAIAFPSERGLSLETTRQGAMGRDFGRFNIQLQADPRQNINHRLTFVNRTRTVERRPHPHVNNSSCLGNTAEMITSAMNQDEISIALSYAINYTGNVNPDDAWGRQIRHWPENSSAREIFDTPEIRESGSMTRELLTALQGGSIDEDDDDDDNHGDDEDHDDDY